MIGVPDPLDTLVTGGTGVSVVGVPRGFVVTGGAGYVASVAVENSVD